MLFYLILRSKLLSKLKPTFNKKMLKILNITNIIDRKLHLGLTNLATKGYYISGESNFRYVFYFY